MAGVDLNVYRFDYDLTFAALLMNADGTIYHTYGGRTWHDPQSHLSTPSFRRALERGAATHAEYRTGKRNSRGQPAETVERLPAMVRRIEAGKKPDCYHCHTVNDMRHEEQMARGTWSRADVWKWPDPIQIGITLDGDDQTKVVSVAADSAAAVAGLRAGDHLRTLGGRRVATFGDVQRALEDASGARTRLAVTWRRGAKEQAGQLDLSADWKEATPLVFSWRASKWPLSPKPGFGGPRLSQVALGLAGLPEDAFAFRIGYLVTWGPNAHTGRNARKAGLRKGDVILSIGGKDDFESVEHFHAWFRLTQKPGTKIPVVRLRKGKRATVMLPVLE